MADDKGEAEKAVGAILLYMLENKGQIFTGLKATAARATKDVKGCQILINSLAEGKASPKQIAFTISKLAQVLSRTCEAHADMALLLAVYVNSHSFDDDATELATAVGCGDEAKALVVKTRFDKILGGLKTDPAATATPPALAVETPKTEAPVVAQEPVAEPEVEAPVLEHKES